MSLIRFLMSGSRGLSKGPAPLGRYRLPGGRVIPDFGGARNPFVSKTLPSQPVIAAADGVTAGGVLTQATPPSSVCLSAGCGPIVEGRRLERIVRALQGRLKAMAVRSVAGIRRFGGALVMRLPGRKAPVRYAGTVAPRAAGPIQGELSLENVRVVRNDLTDTDYEVVCSETVTGSPVKRVPQTVALPTHPRPLGRLAERLFSQKLH